MRKYLYLIILCVVFAGCKGSQQKGKTAESNGKESVANSDGKPAVTVTIPPYKFFVDKIAGDKVDVNVMVSNGNNPETEKGSFFSCEDKAEKMLLWRS